MASKKPKTDFQMTGLKVIQSSLKQLAESRYEIQVGIFGSKAARRNAAAGMTNAEIGYIQEMGSHARGIPRRSFLWDTFAKHGDKIVLPLKSHIQKLLANGKVDVYLKQTGIAAENLVREAFETSGWGAWPKNAYSTLMRKLRGSLERRKQQAAQVIYEGGGQAKPLIDSGQLWQAIASRVAKA